MFECEQQKVKARQEADMLAAKLEVQRQQIANVDTGTVSLQMMAFIQSN